MENADRYLAGGIFALLRHTFPLEPPADMGAETSDHWDLMLEIPGIKDEHCLLTLQLATLPAAARPGPLSSRRERGQVVFAKRLADHRRRYLDFEGPIEGNRGHVHRVARGRYTAVKEAFAPAARWPEAFSEPEQLNQTRSSETDWLLFSLTSDTLSARFAVRLSQPGESVDLFVEHWDELC